MTDFRRFNIWDMTALDELRNRGLLEVLPSFAFVGLHSVPPEYGMTVVSSVQYSKLMETTLDDPSWQRYLARTPLILIVPSGEDVFYPGQFEAIRAVAAVISTDRLDGGIGQAICARQLRREIGEFPYRQNPAKSFKSVETYLDFNVEPVELRDHLEEDVACRTKVNAIIRQFAMYVRAGCGLSEAMDAIRAERQGLFGGLAHVD